MNPLDTARPFAIRQTETCRWEGVPVLPYKEDGSTFKAVSRQTLFPGADKLNVEVRCFEVEPGGHSTLERHDHLHAVLILQGRGQVLLGDHLQTIDTGDFVYIPSMTWHQFQPEGDLPLSFLCLVNPERDRPERPNAEQLETLKQNPEIAEFIKF